MQNMSYLIKVARGLAASLLVLTGCQHPLNPTRQQGAQILFGAISSNAGGIATKTEYSGRDENDRTISAASRQERINWLSSDRIRIWCEQATLLEGSQHYADYQIIPKSNTGQYSRAEVRPVAGNGLQWGAAATHYFYALYPAETIDNGEDVPPATLEAAGGNRVRISGAIPEVQTVTREGSTFRPNMNYAYMYAAKTAYPDESGNVDLDFKPLVTTLQFSIQTLSSNGLPASKRLTTVTLKSEETPLCGDFEALVDASGTPTVSTSDIGKSIRIDLGSGISLSSTEPCTLTVFTLPVRQERLTLELGLSDGTSRSLELKENGVWISVDAMKKIYVNSLGVPNNVWTYSLDPIAEFPVTGSSVLRDTAKTVDVRLKRTNGATTEPVAWKAWYCPTDSNDPSDWREDWGSNWVRLSQYEGDGYTSVNVVAKATVLDGLAMYPGTNATEMINTLKTRRLGGASETTPLDLSAYDFLSHSRNLPAETANCYVINGYGWFAFPLVYGNAVQGGMATADPYTGIATGNNNPLAGFVNADGAPIASPFILDDPNLDTSESISARIVWQDTDQTFEIIKDEDVHIINAPSGSTLSCKYLLFNIEADNIKPGNALVALYDDGKGKILWSWHIWVTDEAFYTQSVATADPSITTNLLNCPLGWTPPISYSQGSADARSQYIVITRASDGVKMGSFRVSQSDYALPLVNADHYSHTYYQWGRKDPFLPSLGHKGNRAYTSRYYCIHASDATLAGMPSEYPTYTSDGTRKLLWMHRNPWRYVFTAQRLPHYGNQWNAHNGGFGDAPVVKSVYDPCPRGFKVPRRSAFSGFTGSGSSNVLGEWVNAANEYPAGMNLTTTHSNNDKNCYFPASGLRGNVSSELLNLKGTTYEYGYSWTAAPYQTSSSTFSCMGLYFTGIRHLITTYMPAANGFPVRPEKD